MNKGLEALKASKAARAKEQKDPAVGADEKEAFAKEQKADDAKMKEIEGKMALGEKEINEDKKLAKVRDDEAAEAVKEQEVAEEKIAKLDKDVNDFRVKQAKEKAKQDAKFGDAIEKPSAPAPIVEANDKLVAANKKISAMFEEDEKIAAEKAAIEAAKVTEAGPNPGVVAAEEAQKKFDAEQAEIKRIEAEKQELIAAAHAAQKKELEHQRALRFSGEAQQHLHGDNWVANMPGYIQETVPYVPVPANGM